jgi:hypothetical protein
MNLKNNIKFIIIFTLAVLLFQWRLITMKSLFIGGDNLTQFYPWFKVYSESIRHFGLPFWTRYMQSGFPLMAEGQVGGYYPLNIIFFLMLPLNLAYNYVIVFHFIIAGASVYLLTRRLGACEWGGTLAAIIFCFGSAYAGCFYNVISLKTLSWTPLVFLLIELFFEKRKPSYIIIAGVIFGVQLLAGFAQLAFYCYIFYLAYYLYRSRLSKSALYILHFSVIALLLFLPQLLLTQRLAFLSSRSTVDLEFALWGSYNPLLIAQTIFPYWPGFSMSDLYFSVAGVLFLITSFYMLKSDKRLRAIFLIFVLSFFLALGKYNPLYVMLLKVGKLYMFRNPSKLLFFTALSASVLAGRGFSEFMKHDFKHREAALKTYSIFLCICASVFIVSKMLFVAFKDNIIKLGEWYAARFIFGRASHRYDPDTYIRKVHDIYSFIIDGTSLKNFFNTASWIFLISALAISWIVIRRRKLYTLRYVKIFVICAVILDLFIYSFIGKGFRSNFRGTDFLKPTHGAIYSYIKNDNDIFRVLPYGVGSGKLPSWIMPNANMIYKIDSVAGYTPLANEYYRKALASIEIIDNSLGVNPPKIGSIDDAKTLLRALNVKYVVSAEKLDTESTELILKEDGIYLYRLKDNLPRAFVLRRLDLDSIDSNIKVKMIEYGSGKAVFKIDMTYDGFLVFSENNYPGWKAYVNGKLRKVKELSLVNTVEFEKGESVVSFVYDPY